VAKRKLTPEEIDAVIKKNTGRKLNPTSLANLQSRKGVTNKNTKAIKDMIEGALTDVGGQAWLAQQAVDNPAAFMQLIAKILPKVVDSTNTHMVIGLAELLTSIPTSNHNG